MKESIPPFIRLKRVRHFESHDSEYDPANQKLKNGWVYLGMKNDSGDIYLILGEPEDSRPEETIE